MSFRTIIRNPPLTIKLSKRRTEKYKNEFTSPEIPERLRFSKWGIAVGDLVQCIQGNNKYKEGKVTEIDKARNELTVEGFNMKEKPIPGFLKPKAAPASLDLMMYSCPVPYSSVRLLAEIPNEDGTTQTVAIKHIRKGPMYFDRKLRKITFKRYIPGLNRVLPWPVPEQNKEEYPGDTPASLVLEKTFIPSMRNPPFPLELRRELGKYDFRRRHLPKQGAQKEPLKIPELFPNRKFREAREKVVLAKKKNAAKLQPALLEAIASRLKKLEL
ncbi:50S ribosomal protein L24, chloroplastic [Neolecta irregularis DAH-3]|uniref:50S ribosomal protein L24, chloroplastic n=1 Tax=Neolecta irregularis (strain DAH-3) TaxID=1198029 RepID=A0A1U7LGQ4_NEOID|nr:50S ribosomal protein L24, chloroplastic [Neolecta irregularis DAH-3]|eukprot:OLL21834.1 50S ribosomal protein L24, chloroplastic [Neolecta irregularis DAH-3]